MRAALRHDQQLEGARRGRGRERRARWPTFAARLGAEVEAREMIPDDRELIEERLRHWADEARLRADPDQRRHRLRARRRHPGGDAGGDRARGAGDRRGDARRLPSPHPELDALPRRRRIRGSTLIVNFPGSPQRIEQTGEAMRQGALPHALELLAGQRSPHGTAETALVLSGGSRIPRSRGPCAAALPPGRRRRRPRRGRRRSGRGGPGGR